MSKAQHILALSAENVKRISVVKIDLKNPNGNVILTGANGQGKSSVLEAIIMALQGKDAFLEKPIRDGQESASVILTTEDFVVKRRFQPSGGTFLEVTNREGTQVVRRPQEILNTMINTIGFDPIEFAQMDAKPQAALLLKICPIALDLEKNKRDQEDVQMRRRDAKRDLDRLQAQTGDEPVGDANEALVSIAGLTKEVSDLRIKQDAQLKSENQIKIAEAKVKELDGSIENHKTLIADLESRKAEVQKFLDGARSKAANPTDYAASIKELSQRLADAESTNERVRANRIRREKVAQFTELQASVDRDTDEIQALAKKREDAFKSIKFPVDGLTINDQGVVSFNGNPLSQCSTAEQIRVGVALAAASNPQLKVAFIKHGSLLDSKSIKLVAEIAQQYDMQVWIERVEDNSPEAIHIVDGTNVTEPQEKSAN